MKQGVPFGETPERKNDFHAFYTLPFFSQTKPNRRNQNKSINPMNPFFSQTLDFFIPVTRITGFHPTPSFSIISSSVEMEASVASVEKPPSYESPAEKPPTIEKNA